METEFEPLRRYKMKGGGIAKVSRIHSIGADDRFPVGFFIERDHHGGERWATATGKHRDNGTSHALDLVLPAIGPEGEVAGFNLPTVRAMRNLQDFWAHFRDSIKCGNVDPSGGDEWPEQGDLAVISCTYPSKEAALSDCKTVISGINSLLGGGAEK